MAQLAEAQELKKRVAIAEATVQNYKDYADKAAMQMAGLQAQHDRQMAELKAHYEVIVEKATRVCQAQVDRLKAHYEGTGPAQEHCQAIANAVMDAVEAEAEAGGDARSVASAESVTATLRGVLEANFRLTNCVEDFVPAAQVCEAVAASLGEISSRTVGKMMAALGYKGKVKKVKGKAITVYEGIALKA
jgi:hypothetical protein